MSPIRSPRLGFFAAFAVVVGSLCLACETEHDARSDGASADLIGGSARLALPSTVHIADNCTGAKIAPKLVLTAAHCVLDLSTLTPKYDATHPVALSNNPHGDGSTPYAVAKVHVHPTYLDRCARTLCSISSVVAKLDAPDVAVIELVDELPGVPIVLVDTQPLLPGEEVIIEGFGCVSGVHVPDNRTRTSLASAETNIVGPETALHDGSSVTAPDLPVYSGNYALTPGPEAVNRLQQAGLCPGDSGGPLYARRVRAPSVVEQLFVVGVNANYTLHPDAVDALGLPVTNWHTRLDTNSRNKVADWLATVVPR